MKVLVLTQYATQEDISIITESLPASAEYTLLSGSDCSLPKGKIIKTVPHNPKSLLSRLKCWVAFRRDVLKWAKSAKNERFDVIYANSNPPINSMLGLKLKKQFNVPFVYMNWDLYPQIIEETYPTFLVKTVCKFWHWYNRRNYPKIDQMITIGPIMAESINKPLNKKIDIDIIPIATDPEFLKPVKKEENRFIKENGLEGKFIVLYSGKLGYGHNIADILSAAAILKDKKDICFVFIGNGPRVAEVEDAIKTGAENVRMYPLQPTEMFKYSVACGDVAIVSQEVQLAHLFLPSKTYSSMSCGTPVIGMCSERDDLKNLIENNKIGIPVVNATPKKIAEAVLSLYTDRNMCKEMGEQGRKVIKEKYSYSVVSNKYKAVFENILGGLK